MKEIFVNLKRFEVPQKLGGICPEDLPKTWIKRIIRESVKLGIGNMQDVSVTYFLPESLLIPAKEVWMEYNRKERGNFELGCQSVFRQDIASGKNFGAFTSNCPAAAIKALDYRWVMVGHSEERKDKLEMYTYYDEEIAENEEKYEKASNAVDVIINEEVKSALGRGLNVLLCIGETEGQKGGNTPHQYEERVRRVLRQQLTRGLSGISEVQESCKIVIGYEPVWAIGPGKIPPGAEYIRFVSKFIKSVCKEEFGVEFPVVYGGGVKEDNAGEIASVQFVDGGLIALTKFDQPIGFDVNSLKRIMENYMKQIER